MRSDKSRAPSNLKPAASEPKPNGRTAAEPDVAKKVADLPAATEKPAAAAAPPHKKKKLPPKKPEGSRGTKPNYREPRFAQQSSSQGSAVQKKKLYATTVEILQEEYRSVVAEGVLLDAAIEGGVRITTTIGKKKKNKKKEGRRLVVTKEEIDAEDLVKSRTEHDRMVKVRDGTGSLLQGAIVHNMTRFFGALGNSGKDRMRNPPSDYYIANKSFPAEGSVQVAQYTPIEQYELAVLRYIELLSSALSRQYVPRSEGLKEKPAEDPEVRKYREALAELQSQILEGKRVRDKAVSSNEAPLLDFRRFASDAMDRDLDDNAKDSILGLVEKDPITFYNIDRLVAAYNISLKERVAKEELKAKNRGEDQQAQPPSTSRKRRGEPKADRKSEADVEEEEAASKKKKQKQKQPRPDKGGEDGEKKVPGRDLPPTPAVPVVVAAAAAPAEGGDKKHRHKRKREKKHHRKHHKKHRSGSESDGGKDEGEAAAEVPSAAAAPTVAVAAVPTAN